MKKPFPLLLLATLSACRTSSETVGPSLSGTSPTPASHAELRLVRTRTIQDIDHGYYWFGAQRLGDWNGDGTVDVLYLNDRSRRDEQVALVISPSDGRTLARWNLPAVAARDDVAARDEVGDAWATPVGDLDGDGRDDVVLASRWAVTDTESTVIVEGVGASRAEPLWTSRVEQRGPPTWMFVEAPCDLDHDGVRDIVIGASPFRRPYEGELSQDALDFLESHPERRSVENGPPEAFGWIEALSGKSGRSLWRVPVDTELLVASRCVGFRDVDRDGTPELALVMMYRGYAPGRSSSADPRARIDLRSGASGERVGRIEDPTPRNGNLGYFRKTMCGGTDVDGDGIADIVVSSLVGEESISVYSGRTHAIVSRITAPPDPRGWDDWMFPSAIEVASDLDGDGWRDLLIGHAAVGTDVGLEYGAIYLQSGRTGALLAAIRGSVRYENLGSNLAWLGDTDHDGRPEFATVTTAGLEVWSIEGVPISPVK